MSPKGKARKGAPRYAFEDKTRKKLPNCDGASAVGTSNISSYASSESGCHSPVTTEKAENSETTKKTHEPTMSSYGVQDQGKTEMFHEAMHKKVALPENHQDDEVGAILRQSIRL